MGLAFRPLLAAAIGIFIILYLSRSGYQLEMSKVAPILSGVFSDVSGNETLKDVGTGALTYSGTGEILVKGLPSELDGKKLNQLGVSDLAKTIQGKRYRYQGTDGTLRLINWKD